MPLVKVDGVEIEVPQGATVLQACELAGKEIPRFCYHERLSIAGNCRMCLVEVKPGPPKPQASCALPAADNQEVFTTTPMVKNAREGMMEFLLINHPLDCPICDQGGECDLQDQSIAYGRGHSRYAENKRAVTEKYMGPIVKTVMTRCIQCTRCVRFAEEVAGVEEIGAIYRGENMQITSYLEAGRQERAVGQRRRPVPGRCADRRSPMRSRRGRGRLRKTLTVDVMDAVGTNIRPRQPRTSGAALRAAHQRGRERGVGDRQDAPCDRRARAAAARSSRIVRVNGKLVPATAGTRRSRRLSCGRWRIECGGGRGRPGRLRDDVCGQGAGGDAGIDTARGAADRHGRMIRRAWPR